MKNVLVIFETENKKYRVLELHDETFSIDDLKGDIFKPEINPEADVEALAQAEVDFENRVMDEGVFGYELERWNPSPGKGYESLDSCFGFVGQYNAKTNAHYIVDELILKAREQDSQDRE